MKKLNATNAIVILSLGLTLSIVVAGCVGGNDTAESAVTKNAKPEKAGTTDGGAGGDSSKPEKAGTTDDGAGNGTTKSAPTTTAKTGSADGGTGESVTVSDSVFQYCDFFDIELSYQIPSGATPDSVCKESVASLTNSQMNALTSAQWEKVDGYLSASQVESIPTKTIKNLTTTFLDGLSAAGTQALTTEQLNSMSKDQLNELVKSDELTDTQLVTVNTRLKILG